MTASTLLMLRPGTTATGREELNDRRRRRLRAAGGGVVALFWGSSSDGSDFWEPQGGERRLWRDAKPGDLIALRRAVWCIREVRAVPVADWDEHDEEYYGWQRGVSREEWRERPLYLIVVPVNGGKRWHVKVRPYATGSTVYLLSPHFPVCRECGEPWPCRELGIAAEVRKQAAKMDRLSKVLPGCCWECGEPVTSRQKTITFEGENLLLPGAPPPVFHLRRGRRQARCLPAAVSYEKRWVAADPQRHPTLYCTGKLIIHADGAECSEDPFCPGPRVNHPSAMNHTNYLEAAVRCLRCRDACAAQGIELPEDPGPRR